MLSEANKQTKLKGNEESKTGKEKKVSKDVVLGQALA
jgi:hypothetical protein